MSDGHDTWWSETVVIAAGDESRQVSMTQQKISGVLLLARRPLAARLSFTDERSRLVSVNSDEQGEFSALLPDGSESDWQVRIESNEPDLQRVVPVHVRPNVPLEIDLPNLMVTGTVIDERRSPVPFALLSIRSVAGNQPGFQPSAGPDGRFTVFGLSPGKYQVSASGLTVEADPVEIEVKAGEVAPEPITLLARTRRHIRGHVSSAFGPVAGATVAVQPTDDPLSEIRPTTTGADGAFALTIPSRTQELDVMTAAPGFAFALDHVHYESGDLSISVDQRGGTLLLQTASRADAFLLVDHATIPLSLLSLQWPTLNEKTKDGFWQIRIPMMQPGSYSLCAVPPENVPRFRASGGFVGADRCSTGLLDPYGFLTIPIR
ncbi:MAG: carboxypeptidase-like regulatory domain-containing protein [Acidobacteriota bacterium]